MASASRCTRPTRERRRRVAQVDHPAGRVRRRRHDDRARRGRVGRDDERRELGDAGQDRRLGIGLAPQEVVELPLEHVFDPPEQDEMVERLAEERRRIQADLVKLVVGREGDLGMRVAGLDEDRSEL